jgi:hypothetical protein
MLYLFNSAFRPLYLKNVLNTLFLPDGCTNEYRYKYSGEPSNVPPATYSQILKLRSGTEAAICFIDRFGAAGYEYHPLRLGKYLSYRVADNYLYFSIELGPFIYARNPTAFKKHFIQALGPLGLPKLTGDDPQTSDDGAYAILGESIFDHTEDFSRGDSAWSSTVQALSETRALSPNQEQSPVFIKVDLHQRSNGTKRVAPALREDGSIFELEKDKSYELSFTYRFPEQRIDPGAKARADIKLGENLRLHGHPSINIDSHANSVLTPFSSKRYLEDISGSITLFPVDEPDRPVLLMSDYSLRYEIRESTGFWLKTGAALLMFSFSGAFIGVDFSKLSPFSLGALLTALWPKLVAGVIQTLALFWVFRLIGKKIV